MLVSRDGDNQPETISFSGSLSLILTLVDSEGLRLVSHWKALRFNTTPKCNWAKIWGDVTPVTPFLDLFSDLRPGVGTWAKPIPMAVSRYMVITAQKLSHFQGPSLRFWPMCCLVALLLNGVRSSWWSWSQSCLYGGNGQEWMVIIFIHALFQEGNPSQISHVFSGAAQSKGVDSRIKSV